MKISIVYYSKTGKTKAMAEIVAAGMKEIEGIEVCLFDVDHVDAGYINESKAVIFGTPTYYANMCWQIKKWFDEGGKYNLSGKLGAAFATANVPQGGADVAILTLVQHMMVKGMMVYSGGTTLGQPFLHLGAAAWRDTFEENKELFHVFGKRIAAKTKELFV
jgi:NAD(P)H dehydrogenase (quinone)